jgi:hypothetical protein
VIGAYVTPLSLYNALNAHPKDIILLDDCAGIFGDSVGMAILKAATWATAGSQGERTVSWNSTSDKVDQPTVAFSGKIILLANSIPQGEDSKAFLSRSLHLQIHFNAEQAAQMLREASEQIEYFDDQETAQSIATFLCERALTQGTSSVNLRALQMGYELARANPNNWQQLLEKLIPNRNPISISGSLAMSNLPVEEQFREFSRLTGLSRRTFFNYRDRVAALNPTK